MSSLSGSMKSYDYVASEWPHLFMSKRTLWKVARRPWSRVKIKRKANLVVSDDNLLIV